MTLRLEDFRTVGGNLRRPEGVAVAPDGSVWASDAHTAAARLEPGPVESIGRSGGEPNGLNFLPSGELLIANFQGPLQILSPREGVVRTFVDQVEDRPVIHANYPIADAKGFVWATESTRFEDPKPETVPQMLEHPDGWIFVRRPDGTTAVVADELVFANGLCFSADGAWLYVAETLNGRIRRARIRRGGDLGALELFHQFAADGLEERLAGLPGPDGIGFDAEGRLWVCLYNRRSLAVLSRDGELVERITDEEGRFLNWPTNVAWGGPDRRTLYVGSIVLPHVSACRVEVPGLPQPWQIATPA